MNLVVPSLDNASTWCKGVVEPKPWEYRVTATIPHLETPELLPTVMDLLRAQTVAPYLVLVDTGSSWETIAEVEKLRAPDAEIHYVRGHGYDHPSEPIMLACDLAFARVTTEYLFLTQVDAFVRRRDFLEDLMSQCDAEHPVVGYEISPRFDPESAGMVGHTATMVHMPTMRRLGITWGMQRAVECYGTVRPANYLGWPDTETSFGLQLREHGIEPVLVGHDTNGEWFQDEHIDHFRSYTVSKIYSPSEFPKRQAWAAQAMQQAHDRLAMWSAQP